ncbi:MAG: YfjI family protein, partial [Phycisphaerae bacterium]
LLSCLAAAIGTSRIIRLKRGWTEPSVIWSGIVGPSGTLKSPALAVAVHPIEEMQRVALEARADAMELYEQSKLAHDVDVSDWKKSGRKNNLPPPTAPDRPICARFVVSDITTEALAMRLNDQPRGVLLKCDELGRWLSSFGAYKAGRGGDDGHFLEMHRAGTLLVDRKTGDQTTIYVPRAAVSICGGIQPATLREDLGRKHFENGLAARLLFCMPPRRRKRWTEAEIPDELTEILSRLYQRLYSLRPNTDGDGNEYPVATDLTADGKAAWVAFYDEHAAEQDAASGDVLATLSKLEGAAARFALIFHFVRLAAQDKTLSNPDAIDAVSVQAGVALARWFAQEMRRVYAILNESEADREQRHALELLQQRGDLTARDLQRSNQHRYRKAEDARRVLDGLVQAGVARAETVQTGGRSVQRFFPVTNDRSDRRSDDPCPDPTDPPPSGPKGLVSLLSSVTDPSGGNSHGLLSRAEPAGPPAPSTKPTAAKNPDHKIADVPEGWEPDRWVAHLYFLASGCEAANPEQAERHREDANRIAEEIGAAA